MPVIFRCEHCRKKLSVSRKHAGREVPCPGCGEPITIPTTETIEKQSQSGTSRGTKEPPPQSNAPSADSETPKPPPAKSPEPAVPSKTSSAPSLSSSPLTASAASRAPRTAGEEDDDDGFTLRGPATDFDDMDLTPMVDVTFLLLIFFMITASFSIQKTIDIPEPDPDEKGAAVTVETMEDLERDSIMVLIDEDNRIYVDDEPQGDLLGLEDLFIDKLRTDGKNELVVEAAEGSLHEFVIRVIDAGNGAGMQRIRLATRSED